MLCKAKDLTGFKLHGIDGEIGKVKEFYFDDLHWTIRYLVADTGTWLTDRKVLVSPYALSFINKEEKYISIKLTKKQIEDSPLLSSDKPVSRQYEEIFYGYYGWPMYFNGPYMWGYYPDIVSDREMWRETGFVEKVWNPNLRSTAYVSGYRIEASDGEIGHVDDFIIDDKTWAIRYLVVDTKNWWPGKKVLISPQWIDSVSWAESKVFVNLPRETIRVSSEYTEESLVTLDYEKGIHSNYKEHQQKHIPKNSHGKNSDHTHAH